MAYEGLRMEYVRLIDTFQVEIYTNDITLSYERHIYMRPAHTKQYATE